MLFFGFQSETDFYKDELHFFLNCLSRGLMNLLIFKGNREPTMRGYGLSESDIRTLINQSFEANQESIEREKFISIFNQSDFVKVVLSPLR